MKILALLLPLTACTDANDPYLVIESQHAPVEHAKTAVGDWSLGDNVQVYEPGTIAFPQPLALQFTVQQGGGGDVPEELAMSGTTMRVLPGSACTLAVQPVCADQACWAEVRLDGDGQCLVEARATTADGATFAECFSTAFFGRRDVQINELARLQEQADAALVRCEQGLSAR